MLSNLKCKRARLKYASFFFIFQYMESFSSNYQRW